MTWKTVKLGEVCETITKGTTPTSVGYKFQQEGINFVKIESISASGNFISSKFAKVSTDCNNALRRSQLKSGDILFSIAGALGRTAIVTDDILPANTNQALAIIRLSQDLSLDLRYILYALNSDSVKVQSEMNRGGVAQQNLSLTQLKNYDIPLPPLAEQERIVAKLDAAFAAIDQGIALTEKKEAEVEQLKAALLSTSLAGDDWKTVKLGEVCEISIGKTPPRKDIRYWDRDKTSGNVWVSIADLSALSGLGISNSKEYISDQGAKLFRPVNPGTLLMSFKLSIGRLAFAEKELRTNEAIAALPVKDSDVLSNRYLRYYLSSQNWDRIAGDDIKIKGKTLNKAKLKELNVLLPPLAEQERIVAKLDAAFAELETARTAIAETKANYQALKAAILAQELQPKESEAA